MRYNLQPGVFEFLLPSRGRYFGLAWEVWYCWRKCVTGVCVWGGGGGEASEVSKASCHLKLVLSPSSLRCRVDFLMLLLPELLCCVLSCAGPRTSTSPAK